MAALTFLGSANGGILSRSTTMALTFLAPITAPTPPRAASRAGRPSLSLNAMPAMQALVLADGAAQRDRDLLAVLRVQHVLAPRSCPCPGTARRRRTSIVPSFLKWMTTQLGEAPCSVKPAIFCWPSAVAEAAAAVGLLDAAGERALAAHARAVGVGEAGARERPGREDQRILRATAGRRWPRPARAASWRSGSGRP